MIIDWPNNEAKIENKNTWVFWATEWESNHHLINGRIILILNRKCMHQQNQNKKNSLEVEELQ